MTVIISGTVLVLLVLILSLVTISKGYAYKHTVDPLDSVEDHTIQKSDQETK